MGRFEFDSTHPYLSGNFKPMRFEGEAPFLEIEGELPADFTGVFYLNGSCPQFPPSSKRYHWFAGDGKVHAYYFRGDSVVDYATRWVRTENFELERRAQRSLFGNKKYGALTEIDPSVRHIRPQLANTNVVFHGGRLLALEDGIAPIELDPWSLETRGSHRFDGRLDSAMTAHVHTDPGTGEMIGFGRQLGGSGSPTMSHQVVNSEGVMTHNEPFESPYCALLHDFAISEDYVAYPLGPAILDPTRPAQGKPVLQWEPHRPAYLGILSRKGPTYSPRWLPMDPCFMWHTLNMYQEDRSLHIDLVRYKNLPGYDTGRDVRSADNPEEYAGRLVRWSVNLDAPTDEVTEHVLDDLISEFPRIDERSMGQKHRHAFFLCLDGKTGASRHWDAAAHLDLQTGRRTLYDPGAQSFVSEGVFAPRVGSTEEGDGYYMVPVYHEDQKRSEVVLLSATDFEAGPIARVKLPFRQNPTFHANFCAGLTQPEDAA
ncbi:MAG TPA: hypothetical protein DIU15_03250 [Deltaproteobacteria bacterium]|nr:hypothetical protein [Deltaproteobacteria bacterium]HCP45028.1 hypothetical protein [Deltaproteobacteria bacterium]|tara:strand:- start:129 stop:1583 length:1455 start_codon:yes stop_codon:yes gene_type:complete